MRTSAEPNRYEYSGKAENGNPCRTKPVVSTVEKPKMGIRAELNQCPTALILEIVIGTVYNRGKEAGWFQNRRSGIKSSR